jgi:hypothetical protein
MGLLLIANDLTNSFGSIDLALSGSERKTTTRHREKEKKRQGKVRLDDKPNPHPYHRQSV